jgi:hypothetical protein
MGTNMRRFKSSWEFFIRTRVRIVSGLVALLLMGFLINGCGDFSITGSSNQDVKEQIRSTADKYGIEVAEIKNGSNNKSALKFKDVDQLDKFFKGLVKRNNKPIKKVFQITKNKNGGQATLKHSLGNASPRLKVWAEDSTGNETVRDWFYNLTWLDVNVTWQEQNGHITNIDVSSQPVGLTVWEFTDTVGSVYTQGSQIHFDLQVYGNIGFGVGEFDGFFYGSGSASGWIDTQTGESSLNANGYW